MIRRLVQAGVGVVLVAVLAIVTSAPLSMAVGYGLVAALFCACLER